MEFLPEALISTNTRSIPISKIIGKAIKIHPYAEQIFDIIS